MQAIKKLIKAAFGAGAEAIILLIAVVAFLLGPFRVGRLLKAVSIPHFRQHKIRTALTVFGIMLGVGVLVAIVLVNRSITASFAETIDSVSGKAKLQVAVTAGGFDETVVDTVKEVEGVYRAAPLVMETALMRDPRAKGDRVLVIGVDLLGKDDEYFRDYDSEEMPAIKDNPIAFLNSTNNIIISNKLAKQFGYKLHDKIPLATPSGTQDFDIWGFVAEQGVGRSFGGAIAIMYYQSAQAAFGKGTKIDKIDIATKEGADVAQVQKEIQAKVGAGLDVDRPEKRTDRVSKLLAGLQTGLMMASFIAVLVGAFLIYNTMAISVVQRRKELGILRALGSTKSATLSLITVEGFLLGVVGALMGVIAGIVLARGMLEGMAKSISEVYLQVAATKLHIDMGLIVGAFSLGVVSAVGSAYIPGREAMAMSPLETIKVKNVTKSMPRFDRFTAADGMAIAFAIGAVLLLRVKPVGGIPLGAFAATGAITMAGAMITPRVIVLVTKLVRVPMAKLFGIEGQMANENLPRDLNRISVTTAALMIGVAMAVAFGGFVGSFKGSMDDWIQQSLPADLFITAAASTVGSKNVPITPELFEPLTQIPGVEVGERLRMIDFDYGDTPIKVLSTDMKVYLDKSAANFQQGDRASAKAGVLAGEVIVSDNFARRFQKRVGDTIALKTPQGEKTLKIAGVVLDYTSDKGTVMMDRATYLQFWGDPLVDTYKLYLTDKSRIEEVRGQITSKYGEQYNLFVLTNSEVKANVSKLVDQTFVVMNALQVVAVIIAVLGIINALLANVLDRIREIGVLRAVGMRRRRVRKMIETEAGLIGFLGDLIGIAVGLLLGWILLEYINLVQTGWYFPYRPPWGDIAITAVIILVVAVFAGWYPARSAAKLNVTEALDYE